MRTVLGSKIANSNLELVVSKTETRCPHHFHRKVLCGHGKTGGDTRSKALPYGEIGEKGKLPDEIPRKLII